MSDFIPFPIHPVILEHLHQLGHNGEEHLNSFLFPRLQELPSPSLFRDMDKAVDLVLEALQQQKDIIIWGDYDVDGITSTALLVLFFRALGVEVSYHIPNRLSEGYGLNIPKLLDISRKLGEEKLLITVDCGISNSTEIEEAQKLGFKVIVTDHHKVPYKRLKADAIINPKQTGCNFPEKNLAGVGVAFYLAAAINSSLDKIDLSGIKRVNMKSFLDLVSVGTIADVMPLLGVNRLLVKGGFEVLSASQGQSNISVLFDEMGTNTLLLSSDVISFQAAPAINAAGRLGESETPLELMVSKNPQQSKRLATRLIKLNEMRKKIGKNDLQKALDLLDMDSIYRNKCIVLIGDFHDGIIGITAARLVDMYNVPALVCCKKSSDEGFIKGSGRAPSGFDLYQAIASCEEKLESFGGHAAAAGFTVKVDSFLDFKESFEHSVLSKIIDKNNNYSLLEKKYLTLSLQESLEPKLLADIGQLEPTGECNPRPIFMDQDVRFVSIKIFGKFGEHFRGAIRGNYKNIDIVGFGLGQKMNQIDRSVSCSLTYSHMIDYYDKKPFWRIRAEDIWQ